MEIFNDTAFCMCLTPTDADVLCVQTVGSNIQYRILYQRIYSHTLTIDCTSTSMKTQMFINKVSYNEENIGLSL